VVASWVRQRPGGAASTSGAQRSRQPQTDNGTAADKGTEAALTAYPGAVVNRVVKLSNGWYSVHFIGVNWPHHVFLNQDFKVVGTE
jgi:hypothetical protein